MVEKKLQNAIKQNLANIPQIYPPCIVHKTSVYKRYINCKDHVLCELCQVECFNKGYCIICYKKLSAEEEKNIEDNLLEFCILCKNNFFPDHGEYKQVLCKNCLSSNFLLENQLNKSNEDLMIMLKEEKPKKRKISLTLCHICLKSYTRDEMITLDCDHFFCGNCLKEYILEFSKNHRDDLHKGINCPECLTYINDHTIMALLSAKEQDELINIYIYSIIIECPKCKDKFIADESPIKCMNCRTIFCIKCFRLVCNCHQVEEFKLFDDMKCCPGCHTPYFKDQGCDHLKCLKPGCEVDFCYSCSAFRDPIMAHGNHYHRPNCKFYSPHSGFDDRYSKDCSRCRKEGKLCDRPKDLKKSGRFSIGEI